MDRSPSHQRSRSDVLDNLTHALVGAAISKSGAQRTTPLATMTLIVAANAPDVDVLSYARGEYFALAFRRGITHGLPALIVLPFVVTACILAFDRSIRLRRHPESDPVRPLPVLGLSAVGVATHPALDWMNTYGMRWGLPFDDAWTYGDALFIIDPWIWLVLGGALVLSSAPSRPGVFGWSVLATLTTALMFLGIGGWPAAVWLAALVAFVWMRSAGRTAAPLLAARGVARAGFVVATYIGLMLASDRVARVDVQEAAMGLGRPIHDVMVAPLRGNPFAADVEVLTDAAFIPGTHRWFRTPRVELRLTDSVPLLMAPRDLSRDVATRVVDAARERAVIRNYLTWSRYPYVRIARDGPGWQVRFSDARYDSQPGAAGLAGVSVHISSSDLD